MAPLIMFRDPVKRAVSHYYHTKDNDEKAWKMKHQNLSEYFSDVLSMMETRKVWYDREVRPNQVLPFVQKIGGGNFPSI